MKYIFRKNNPKSSIDAKIYYLLSDALQEFSIPTTYENARLLLSCWENGKVLLGSNNNNNEIIAISTVSDIDESDEPRRLRNQIIPGGYLIPTKEIKEHLIDYFEVILGENNLSANIFKNDMTKSGINVLSEDSYINFFAIDKKIIGNQKRFLERDLIENTASDSALRERRYLFTHHCEKDQISRNSLIESNFEPIYMINPLYPSGFTGELFALDLQKYK